MIPRGSTRLVTALHVCAAAAFVAALLPGPALAGVILDSGVGPGQIAHGGYSCTNCPGSFETADTFAFATATMVTDVHWWGTYFNESSQQPDDFLIRISGDDPTNPGLPTPVGTELYAGAVGPAGRFDTAQVVGGAGIMAGLPIFGYSAVLPTPFVAAAGTTYWVSIVNASAAGWVWGLEVTSAHYIAQSSSDTNVFNYVYPARAAFQLTDDANVPEPVTVTLLITGLAGLVASRRRL